MLHAGTFDKGDKTRNVELAGTLEEMESRAAEGDIEGAWEASRKARLWALWSAGSVGIAVVVGIAFAVITEMTR